MPSNDVNINVKNLVKRHRLFGHPGDRIKQALTLGQKKYHREFTSLDNVSLQIDRGETVGIIGKNGSGKSTLLQLICGILKPSSGEVNVSGNIAALLELGAGFNPEFTGKENIYFQGAVMGLSRYEIDQRFSDIVEFAEIGSFIDQPVRTYSSGMFVRLAFSAMIHTDADILVVDEALGVGDEAFQRKCFDKLADYLEGKDKILLFVSHNIRQVERICSEVVWLDKGKIVETGEPVSVCNSYQKNVQENYHDSLNVARPKPNVAYSGEVDVNSITLHRDNEAKNSNEFEMHNAVRFLINLTFHSRITNPEINIGIHTNDSVMVTACSTYNSTDLKEKEFSTGEHVVECQISDLMLMPGIYHIRLAIFDKYRRNLWVGRKLCTFRVSNSKEAPGRAPEGLVDFPVKWKISN